MTSAKWFVCFALTIGLAAGCEDSSYQDYSDAPLSGAHGHDHDHGHAHSGHTGKYGGQVLELDDAHGHHAELVFDNNTRDVTLYFYGREIGVAKAATGLAFEVEKDGKEVVLNCSPSPLDGETAETCSRFVIAGSQFPKSVTSADQLAGHFHVMIDGKEFVGDLPGHHGDGHDHHAHDHEDAAHAHTEKSQDHATDENSTQKAAEPNSQ